MVRSRVKAPWISRQYRLVLGDVFRRSRRDGLRRLEHALQPVVAERGEGGGAGEAAAQHVSEKTAA